MLFHRSRISKDSQSSGLHSGCPHGLIHWVNSKPSPHFPLEPWGYFCGPTEMGLGSSSHRLYQPPSGPPPPAPPQATQRADTDAKDKLCLCYKSTASPEMPCPHFQPDSCPKCLLGKNFRASRGGSLRCSHVSSLLSGAPCFITAAGALLRALHTLRPSYPSTRRPEAEAGRWKG